MIRREINIITGEEKIIELTQQEINQANINTEIENNLKMQIIAKEEQDKINKQSALNKLKALGLNDAEIKAIIGI